MTEETYRIVRLEVENVKRIEVAEVFPNGNLVCVGGNNEQGKSSLLDSIVYALAGAKSLPGVPVRNGASEAEIVVDLGDLIVTRKIASTGATTLNVTNADGAKAKKPQELLDRLVGALTFDPLRFSTMPAKDQIETLRKLVGLDFTEVNTIRQALYEERTIANRQVRDLQGEIKTLRFDPALPKEPISVGAIAQEISAADQLRRKYADLRLSRDAFSRLAEELAGRLERTKADLAKASAQLAELDPKVTALPDKAEMDRKVADIEATNRGVRANLTHTEVKKKLKVAEELAQGLTESIEALDAKKRSMVAETKFPLDGISLGDDCVMLRGVPFSQASSAEQLCASVAMGIAMNPKLKVLLIRDGSLLDGNHLEAVAQMAADAGAQVWMERVGEGAECQVIFEAGKIKETK